MSFSARKTMMRAAAVLAALYVVCFLAPVAAVAFSHSKGAIHCLTTPDHGLAKSHSHDNGDEHHHMPADTVDHETGQASVDCCGLFCVSGLTSVRTEFVPNRALHRIARLQSYLPLVERGPERHYKPPIDLLS